MSALPPFFNNNKLVSKFPPFYYNNRDIDLMKLNSYKTNSVMVSPNSSLLHGGFGWIMALSGARWKHNIQSVVGCCDDQQQLSCVEYYGHPGRMFIWNFIWRTFNLFKISWSVKVLAESSSEQTLSVGPPSLNRAKILLKFICRVSRKNGAYLFFGLNFMAHLSDQVGKSYSLFLPMFPSPKPSISSWIVFTPTAKSKQKSRNEL